ncbi:AAA family ATPase [Planctomycetes bacterium K23_9]|uniref:Recombination protein F n=1 Tax=Stieleria marina TaxID=1930275 RepID=A0A517NUH8_9BACT|nr:recombination protein F [Planctomycetes bacterium K23_9]
MKLRHLTLHGFKNLDGLEVDFDSEFDTFVMLGGNGTGKSNLIEAIVSIFADVDLRRAPSFTYQLSYECRKEDVLIKGKSGDPVPTVTVSRSQADLPRENERTPDYLPDNIVAYYSGPGSRLETHFLDHRKREYEALRDPEKATYTPFLYCEPCYSDFLLLACFGAGSFDIREFVSGRMGIREIESVLFDIVKPQRAPTRSRAIAKADGDERFWDSTGEIANILGLLSDNSLAPSRSTEADENDFRANTKKEHLFLFLQDQDSLKRAARPFGESFGFFRQLCYLNTLGMVNDLTIKIHRRGQKKPFPFADFSEGERQLITIIGLLRMVSGGESLILLDEPDTHLNPRWKYDFLDILKQHAGDSSRNQVVIATHDPLVIGELRKEQVLMFQQDRETYQVEVQHPLEDPIGQGVAGLLKSEMFGLPSTLDSHTTQKIHRRYELYSMGDERTEEQTEEMHKIIGELSLLGFATDYRDPYYEKFAKALSRRPEFKKPQLTAAEREDQEEIADEILDEILGADG